MDAAKDSMDVAVGSILLLFVVVFFGIGANAKEATRGFVVVLLRTSAVGCAVLLHSTA